MLYEIGKQKRKKMPVVQRRYEDDDEECVCLSGDLALLNT